MQEDTDLLVNILQNIDSGITVQNEMGHLIYANEMAASMTGMCSPEELLKSPVLEVLKNFVLFDQNNRRFNLRNLPSRRALQGQKPPPLILRYKKHGSGEIRWAHIKSVPIFDQEGKVKYVINVFQDITKKREQDDSIDHFIAAASHELKTPLAGVKALNQLIEKNYRENNLSIIPSLVVKIDDKVNILTKIINDFLDSAKIRSANLDFNPEMFELDKLVDDIIKDYQNIYKKNKIVIEGRTKKTIVADRFRIQQVLDNLLRNANKYSPTSEKVIVKLSSTKNSIKVAVVDHGVGINKVDIKHIFQPFYRGMNKKSSNAGGIGLGLYISNHIVELHGGRMGVKSKVGKGSEFYFSLPLKPKINLIHNQF